MAEKKSKTAKKETPVSSKKIIAPHEEYLIQKIEDVIDKVFNFKVGTYSKIDSCRNTLSERIDGLYKLIKIAVGASIFGAIVGIIGWVF